MTDRPRVTIMGGTGFIGRPLCRAFLDAGFSVNSFGRTHRKDRQGGDLMTYSACRIEDTDAVIAAIEHSDLIVHLVNTTVPGSSMADVGFDISSNLLPNVQWMNRLNETEVKRVIFVSSGGTVYGVTEPRAIDESSPTNPITAYGVTKLALEKYLRILADRNGVELVIARPSNIYGIGQNFKSGQGLVGVFIDRILRGEAIKVWGDGSTVRDYLSLQDFCAAILGLASYTGEHALFNVSSGVGVSVRDVLSCIEAHLGELRGIEYLPARNFDVPYNVLSSKRLFEATGWQPKIAFEAGVAEMIDQMKRDL